MRTTKKTFKVSHKTFGKLEIEAEMAEAENHSEGVNWIGGEAESLKGINYLALVAVKRDIASAGQNPTEDETKEQFIEKVRSLIAGAKPRAGRVGPSNSDRLDFAKELESAKATSEDGEVSPEKFMEIAQRYGIL